MKRTILAVAALIFSAAPLIAQQPELPQQPQKSSLSQQPPTLTPELWLYLQELQRQDDPKQAVRRNAEYRAAQRRHRLSSAKWFGYSNQRPPAFATPFMGTYSPHWVGNSYDGNTWVGQGQPWTANIVPYTVERR